MQIRTFTVSLSLAALVLAPGARAQDEAPQPTRVGSGQPVEQRPADLDDVSPDELPAVRSLVSDEALHRDRLARIRRLRELAAADRDQERLARLDDLERREMQQHDARRIRSRAELSERSWESTENFVRRGGVMRVRTANQQAQRERAAAHQSARERAAAADKASRSTQGTRSSSSRPASRPASRPSSGSRGPR
jgi:hypothetical protein